MQDTDIYIDKNPKGYISAEAFIFLSIAGIKLRDSMGLVRCILPGLMQLCKFFAETIIKGDVTRNDF